MSVQPPTDDTEPYCQPADVAEFFDKYEDGFTEQTNPSRNEVMRRIDAESNWVDQFTGHAWRERTVLREYHDLDGPYRHRSGTPISLGMRDIRTPLDESKGDKLELWRGNGYDDFVSDPEFEYGRDGDYWIEESIGMLYLYRRYVHWERHREIRITYRYGKEEIPPMVSDAVAKRAAAYFLESQQYRITTPGNDDAPNADQIAEKWREQTKEDLKVLQEVRSSGL